MRIGIRGLVAAGGVSLLATMGPAAVASAAPAGRPAGSTSEVPTAPPGEVKGFVILRGFPRGELVKGGMGTYKELCSRGNNGRPFEFKEETRLDVTVTHKDSFFDPYCDLHGPESTWQLVIASPDGVKGTVDFFLGYAPGVGNLLNCRSQSGAIRCLDDRISGADLRMIVEPRR